MKKQHLLALTAVLLSCLALGVWWWLRGLFEAIDQAKWGPLFPDMAAYQPPTYQQLQALASTARETNNVVTPSTSVDAVRLIATRSGTPALLLDFHVTTEDGQIHAAMQGDLLLDSDCLAKQESIQVRAPGFEPTRITPGAPAPNGVLLIELLPAQFTRVNVVDAYGRKQREAQVTLELARANPLSPQLELRLFPDSTGDLLMRSLKGDRVRATLGAAEVRGEVPELGGPLTLTLPQGTGRLRLFCADPLVTTQGWQVRIVAHAGFEYSWTMQLGEEGLLEGLELGLEHTLLLPNNTRAMRLNGVPIEQSPWIVVGNVDHYQQFLRLQPAIITSEPQAPPLLEVSAPACLRLEASSNSMPLLEARGLAWIEKDTPGEEPNRIRCTPEQPFRLDGGRARVDLHEIGLDPDNLNKFLVLVVEGAQRVEIPMPRVELSGHTATEFLLEPATANPLRVEQAFGLDLPFDVRIRNGALLVARVTPGSQLASLKWTEKIGPERCDWSARLDSFSEVPLQVTFDGTPTNLATITTGKLQSAAGNTLPPLLVLCHVSGACFEVVSERLISGIELPVGSYLGGVPTAMQELTARIGGFAGSAVPDAAQTTRSFPFEILLGATTLIPDQNFKPIDLQGCADIHGQNPQTIWAQIEWSDPPSGPWPKGRTQFAPVDASGCFRFETLDLIPRWISLVSFYRDMLGTQHTLRLAAAPPEDHLDLVVGNLDVTWPPLGPAPSDSTYPLSHQLRLELYDATSGSQVLSLPIGPDQVRWESPALPAGSYHLFLMSNRDKRYQARDVAIHLSECTRLSFP